MKNKIKLSSEGKGIKDIDADTLRIIKELHHFRRNYRRRYVLMIVTNFIRYNC